MSQEIPGRDSPISHATPQLAGWSQHHKEQAEKPRQPSACFVPVNSKKPPSVQNTQPMAVMYILSLKHFHRGIQTTGEGQAINQDQSRTNTGSYGYPVNQTQGWEENTARAHGKGGNTVFPTTTVLHVPSEQAASPRRLHSTPPKTSVEHVEASRQTCAAWCISYNK